MWFSLILQIRFCRKHSRHVTLAKIRPSKCEDCVMSKYRSRLAYWGSGMGPNVARLSNQCHNTQRHWHCSLYIYDTVPTSQIYTILSHMTNGEEHLSYSLSLKIKIETKFILLFKLYDFIVKSFLDSLNLLAVQNTIKIK